MAASPRPAQRRKSTATRSRSQPAVPGNAGGGSDGRIGEDGAWSPMSLPYCRSQDMPDTSHSLLDRLRDDPHAPDWRKFTQLYEPLVRSWLRRKDIAEHDADDVVQNIMTVVVKKVGEFQHNGRAGAFRTWLRSITVNCLRDHWRSRRAAPAGVGGSDLQIFIAQLADSDSELSRKWDQEHDRHVMRTLLNMLKGEFEPRTWQAFKLFALDGVPAAKVAEELKMTPNAVFIAKSRVLTRLRAESAGLLDE